MKICPNCTATLERFTFQHVVLDTCPQCAGIWFDAGELKRIQDIAPEAWGKLEAGVKPHDTPGSATQAQGSRKCPRCSVELEPYRYLYHSDILLDECPQCAGVWVDDKELAAMSVYLDAHEEESGRAPFEVMAAMQRAGNDAQVPERRAENMNRFVRFFWKSYGSRWGQR